MLLALVLVVEGKTSAMPVLPLRMLRGVMPAATEIANVCVGMAADAVSLSRKQFLPSTNQPPSFCS